MTLGAGAAEDRTPVLQNIQTLRFLAAFWVVLFHARVPVLPASLIPSLPGWLEQVFAAGFFGVDIFFVLSGAIMAESTRRVLPGAAAGLRFAALRFARIYAGWWPFFVLYAAAHYFYRGMGEKNLLGSFFLLPLPLHEYLLPIIWTLSFELYFYAVLGLLFFLPRAKLRMALAAWGALAAAATLLFAWQGRYAPARFSEVGLLQDFLLFPLVLEFVAGFMLCEWVRSRSDPRPWPWVLLAATAGAGAIAYQHLGNLHPVGLGGFFHAPERAILLGGAACGLVGCALTIAPARGRLFGEWLPRLGDASYALYLGHILFLGTLYYALQQAGVSAGWALALYIGALLAVVAAALLHHRWIERPLYELVRRSISRRV